MIKEKLREVPLKNYVILGVVIIVSMFLLYYFYLWVDAYNETKLNRPILDKYMEVINYNELDNYLTENPNAIIYVSVLENVEIRNFEKKFKGLFKNYEIEKNIIYLDITECLKDKKILREIKEKYSINAANISNVPSIMVYDSGNLKAIYFIKDNDYDVERLKAFINGITFSDEESVNG